jgi:hypothetical protein
MKIKVIITQSSPRIRVETDVEVDDTATNDDIIRRATMQVQESLSVSNDLTFKVISNKSFATSLSESRE